MKFLSYIRDLLSGRIYYHNKLIGSNVIKLLKNVQKRPKSDFIRMWVYSCVGYIDSLFSYLLFKENSFKVNIYKLDKQKMFDAFQLLCIHFVIVFLKNKGNLAVLHQEGLDAETFMNDIFSVFNLTIDRAKYRNLDAAFPNDSPKYFVELYDEIFVNILGAPSKGSLGSSLVFAQLLTNAYTSFIKELNVDYQT